MVSVGVVVVVFVFVVVVERDGIERYLPITRRRRVPPRRRGGDGWCDHPSPTSLADVVHSFAVILSITPVVLVTLWVVFFGVRRQDSY